MPSGVEHFYYMGGMVFEADALAELMPSGVEHTTFYLHLSNDPLTRSPS